MVSAQDASTEHPVQIVCEDDLVRNRLTVFFRFFLAIPHYLFFVGWTILVWFAAIAGWIAVVVTGRLPAALHRFLGAYVVYTTRLFAYLALTADPYPPFGSTGSYPIDLQLPEPVTQSRVSAFFRGLLALPALLLTAILGGAPYYVRAKNHHTAEASVGGLLTVAAFLGWFASLVRGEMPNGLRDAQVFVHGYRAQANAYFLLLTPRYPNSDPSTMLAALPSPAVHPVHLVGEADDLRRSRVTVFFRFFLAIPHLIWLALWSIAAFVVAIVQWFVTLFTGTPNRALHNFLSHFVRYELHVYAFLFLTANPFPGFVGDAGSYPLDLVLPAAERQNRWTTGFRGFLVIPAVLVSSSLGGVLVVTAILMWFVGLFRGTAPWGLRNLSAYALRYGAQLNAYALFVTGTYPYASPLEGAPPATVEPAAADLAA